MSENRPPASSPTPEERAWFEEHLTHEVWRRMYNEAYRFMHNKSDAEDIAGEAVRIGLAKISELRNKEKFVSWLLKIVRTEAIHHLERQHKTYTIKRALWLIKDLYETSTTPEKLLISKEESERLRAEIKRLRSPEKEIMMLKLTTRKSLKEIAAELNLNYHTTRSKFTRACKLLKRRLEKEEGDDADEKK